LPARSVFHDAFSAGTSRGLVGRLHCPDISALQPSLRENDLRLDILIEDTRLELFDAITPLGISHWSETALSEGRRWSESANFPILGT
jgi:hypothetical protein